MEIEDMIDWKIESTLDEMDEPFVHPQVANYLEGFADGLLWVLKMLPHTYT